MDSNLRKISSQRLPPPALFQGPPSHNASNLSLAPVPTAGSTSAGNNLKQPPLQRNRSPRTPGPIDNQNSLSPFLTRTQSKGDVDGSEAIWQEMQNALSEVELSAVNSEHIFGEKHSEALEALRATQLKLAQTWVQSEAEESVDTKGPDEKKNQTAGGTVEPSASDDVAAKTLDEETEKDILLARERRDANDRYFDRVNNGVLEVVSKLEEVAQAMRTVERESKDIWSDSDSMATTPSTTNTS